MNDQITQAALRWAELRRWALILQRRRAVLDCMVRCESESSGSCRELARLEGKWADKSEWCESCRRKEKVHRAFRRIAHQRGAAMHALVTLCNKAAKQEGSQ